MFGGFISVVMGGRGFVGMFGGFISVVMGGRGFVGMFGSFISVVMVGRSFVCLFGSFISVVMVGRSFVGMLWLFVSMFGSFIGFGFTFVCYFSLVTVVVVCCVLHDLRPAVRKQNAVFSRGDFAVVTLPLGEDVVGVRIVHIHIEVEGLELLLLFMVIAGVMVGVRRLGRVGGFGGMVTRLRFVVWRFSWGRIRRLGRVGTFGGMVTRLRLVIRGPSIGRCCRCQKGK